MVTCCRVTGTDITYLRVWADNGIHEKPNHLLEFPMILYDGGVGSAPGENKAGPPR
jgi:hypothetical protein